MIESSFDDELYFETDTSKEIEKSFTHKPLYKRCLIVLAGPIMNLVLAFVIFTIIFMVGMK